MFQKCRYDNNKLTKIWSKKVKIRAKKALDTVDKKRPKKEKLKGQKLSFRSVDSNKLTKNKTKKAKIRARKCSGHSR